MDDESLAKNDSNEVSEKTKKKVGEEFLHVIDVDKVVRETGLSVNELSDLLNVDVQSINRWSCTKAKSGNRPKFNSAVRLLMHGATVETLFGVEYNKIHGLGGKIKITNEDISNAMLVAAELLRNQKNENSPASENNESVDDVNDSIENG
jgi:DNA-binding transcriptional regulator YiaG